MLRTLGTLLLLAAAPLAWLSLGDRRSTVALHVVEWDGRLHLPLYGWALILGVALVVATRRRVRPTAAPRPGPNAIRKSAAEATLDGMSFRQSVLSRAGVLPLGDGARILADEIEGVPLTLVLEHVPPVRARKAVETLGLFLSSLPTPPRVAVVFRDCPEGGAPRNHQVAGALATHLPRAGFRTIANADRVDVIFVQPDVAWQRW